MADFMGFPFQSEGCFLTMVLAKKITFLQEGMVCGLFHNIMDFMEGKKSTHFHKSVLINQDHERDGSSKIGLVDIGLGRKFPVQPYGYYAKSGLLAMVQ